MKHLVDVYVGKRVRQRRWMLGMTQQQLGDRVGIKFQQIQKYETGMNRISASRLWDIAQTMGTTIDFFFEGLAPVDAADHPAAGSVDPMAEREAIELIKAYTAIPEEQRRRLFDLARALGAAA